MRALALLCLVCLTFTSHAATAGTLSRARGEVRREAKPKASKSSTRDRDEDDKPQKTNKDDRPRGRLSQARREVRRHDDNHRGHGGGGHYACPPRFVPSCGPAGFFSFHSCAPPPVVETYVIQEPVVVTQPAIVEEVPVYVESVGPTCTERLCRQFAPYPYALGADGFMLTTTPGCGHGWSGRIQVEGGSDFDAIDRTGLSFLIEGQGGLGIDFDWDSYSEDLPGGGQDEVHVGEFDVLYRFAETDQTLLRAGLGAAWFGDRYDTDFGINFTLKADFAPCDPVVLSGEIDLGTLGDAEHLHLSGTAGVMLNRCEIYGGYDYRRIGEVEIQGPMVGLRFWF
ncbi:hypothetical protein NG895_19625 [Aeoliella sp. ICT_H6.2]|uniref:Outer membrane protein with beta-barrel domain n=1 Tax=Aeoliella straminimaris TaxID=2954799 RepID=A0A9X2FHI6_9BACT|nr:hypothetical protein [Aeoliella straminimaris]MCO6046116.1 hypothetical protein [Aeoliella straminimaris]